MQVTELRIGSLLLLDNEPVKINGIIPFDGIWVLKVKKGDKYLSSSGQDLEPIPLTEKSLFDFGFKLHKSTPNYDPLFYKSTVFLKCWNGRIHLNKHYDTQVKYVHQLQNLYFALTGREL